MLGLDAFDQVTMKHVAVGDDKVQDFEEPLSGYVNVLGVPPNGELFPGDPCPNPPPHGCTQMGDVCMCNYVELINGVATTLRYPDSLSELTPDNRSSATIYDLSRIVLDGETMLKPTQLTYFTESL